MKHTNVIAPPDAEIEETTVVLGYDLQQIRDRMPELADYAENRDRGNENAEEGRAFELSYLIDRILKLAIMSRTGLVDPGEVLVRWQPDGFVDDIAISVGGVEVRTECKRRRRLSWNLPKPEHGKISKSLRSNFQYEASWARVREVEMVLELVVPGEELRDELRRKRKRKPDVRHVAVKQFQDRRLPGELQRTERLYSDIATLCHPLATTTNVVAAYRYLKIAAEETLDNALSLFALMKDASAISRGLLAWSTSTGDRFVGSTQDAEDNGVRLEDRGTLDGFFPTGIAGLSLSRNHDKITLSALEGGWIEQLPFSYADEKWAAFVLRMESERPERPEEFMNLVWSVYHEDAD